MGRNLDNALSTGYCLSRFWVRPALTGPQLAGKSSLVFLSSLHCYTTNDADTEDIDPALREVEQVRVEQRRDDGLNNEKRPDPTLLTG